MSGSGPMIEQMMQGKSNTLQMPVMGDPLQYINPYYTRQSAGDSLSPLAAFRQSIQGGPQMQMQGGWTPFQAPTMPTVAINTAPMQRAQSFTAMDSPAMGHVSNYSGDRGGFSGGYSGGDFGGTNGMAGGGDSYSGDMGSMA